MPDNERDQAVEQVAHVLIDVATEDVTADAYDMSRALDREGLLRTGDDTISGHGYKGTAADGAFVGDLLAEVAKLRAERDRLIEAHQKQRRFADQNFENWQRAERERDHETVRVDRAVAETAALRDAVRALHQPTVCTGYPDCNPLFGGGCAHAGDCRECRREHPCPTISALDGGQS